MPLNEYNNQIKHKDMMIYKGTAVYLKRGTYANGAANSLAMIDATDHFPYANCTINVPGLDIDEVAIKDYSENEGMLEFLINEEIVEKPHREVYSGYVSIPVCRLR